MNIIIPSISPCKSFIGRNPARSRRNTELSTFYQNRHVVSLPNRLDKRWKALGNRQRKDARPKIEEQASPKVRCLRKYKEVFNDA